MFADETGAMLQPCVRKTWAPRGQTPIHKSWARHDRLSVIGALRVSPKRRVSELHFSVQDRNVKAPDFEAFMAALLRRHGRLLAVLDRWSVHRAAVKRLQRRFPKRFEVEWLPPYAPDLNPVEQVWAHTKHLELGNFIPNDLDHLRLRLCDRLKDKRFRHGLHKQFFHHAGLPL